MQLGQAQIVRSDWIDRSPIGRNIYFSGDVTSDTGTDRDTYTVPAGKAAKVGGILASLTWSSGTRGTFLKQASVQITTNGGADITVYKAVLTDDQPGDVSHIEVNADVFLQEGDTVILNTYQISSGLGYRMTLCASITEFDA